MSGKGLASAAVRQEPNAELRWYYQEAASELGVSAQTISDMPPGTPDLEPTWRQCKAAERHARVRKALKALSPVQRALLERCYLHTSDRPDLRRDYGVGAGAVEHVERSLTEAEVWERDRCNREAAAASRVWERAVRLLWRRAELTGYDGALCGRELESARAAHVALCGANAAARSAARALAQKRRSVAQRPDDGASRPSSLLDKTGAMVVGAHRDFERVRAANKAEDRRVQRVLADRAAERHAVFAAERRARRGGDADARVARVASDLKDIMALADEVAQWHL